MKTRHSQKNLINYQITLDTPILSALIFKRGNGHFKNFAVNFLEKCLQNYQLFLFGSWLFG